MTDMWIDIETGAVHADSGIGNYHTICGDHLAGSDEKSYPMIETRRNKITCPRCIGVIAYAKLVLEREIGEPMKDD